MKKVLMLIACAVSVSAFGQANDVETMINQLKLLGYNCQLSDKKISISHPSKLNFEIYRYKGGYLFKSWFSAKKKSSKSKEDFFSLVNTLNSETGVARFYIDKDGDLIIEGWYPLPYSPESFATFMGLWEKDFGDTVQKNYEELSAFIE